MKTANPIFYLCNDPERALGLEKLLPNYHIVCIDNTPLVHTLQKQGIKIFSLAEKLNEEKPIYRNTNRLVQHRLTQEYIYNNTPKGTTPHIIVFKIAKNIEVTAQELGYTLLNTSTELNHLFETKLSQYQQLSEVGVNFPPTLINKLEERTYTDLASDLGDKFVVQFDRGHTGIGTIFISSQEEYQALQDTQGHRTVRIAKYIEREAWTINAAVTKFGIAMGGLSYQITGIKGLTEQAGGTVGNDWSMVDQLTQNQIDQIQEQTELIGKTMGLKEYKGLFGIDFVVDDSNVYVIEVNARQPASVGMHTKLMLKENRIPLQLLHIAEFLFPTDIQSYIDYIHEIMGVTITNDLIQKQNLEEIKPQQASQVIARKLSIGRSFTGPADAGIYDTDKYLRPGSTVEDIQAPDELLLLKQISINKIKPGYESARIQMLAPHSEILKAINILKD